MRNRLFIFGRFAHYPQGVFTAINRLALVSIKLCLNIGTLKLRVATLAYADYWWAFFHDPQLALWHVLSLTHPDRGEEALWKTNGTTTEVWTSEPKLGESFGVF
jgi:hypothetical protein